MADEDSQEDPVVSSDGDVLILVDSHDRELGYLSKARCHDGDGVLHRAFSLFVLDHKGRILLQRRAGEKRLWPGYWSNACCSHPRRGEEAVEAVERRASEELGLRIHSIEYLFKFEYHARFDARGAEHELCHVYVARADEEPRPNRNEIDAWDWYTAAELDEMLATSPEACTPWLRMEWERLQDEFADRLTASGYDPDRKRDGRIAESGD